MTVPGPLQTLQTLQPGEPPPPRPPTPAQKRFDDLSRRIERAQQDQAAWHAAVAGFWREHARVLGPLKTQIRGARRAYVKALDVQLARPGWSRPEEDTLQSLILDIGGDLLDDDPTDDEIKQLFDRHADVDYDRMQADQQEALERLRQAMGGDGFGFDFDGEHGTRGAGGRGSADADRPQADADTHPRPGESGRSGEPDPSSPPRAKPAGARRREQEAALAAQTVRDLYRKLASALHPDREPDAERRQTKTLLMQQANQAYEAGDLPGLLDLQRRTARDGFSTPAASGGKVGGGAAAEADRLKLYNRALAERLAALQADIDSSQTGFLAAMGLQRGRGPVAQQLPWLIDEAARELKALLAQQQHELRQLADGAATRRWLRSVRATVRRGSRRRN